MSWYRNSVADRKSRRERALRAASALDVRQILSSCEVPSVSGSVWCSNVGEIRLLLALMVGREIPLLRIQGKWELCQH